MISFFYVMLLLFVNTIIFPLNFRKTWNATHYFFFLRFEIMQCYCIFENVVVMYLASYYLCNVCSIMLCHIAVTQICKHCILKMLTSVRWMCILNKSNGFLKTMILQYQSNNIHTIIFTSYYIFGGENKSKTLFFSQMHLSHTQKIIHKICAA